MLDAGDKPTLVNQSSPLAGSIASNDWVCTNKGNDWTPVKASFGEERGGSVPDYGTRWTDGYNSSVSGFGVGAEVAEADKWPGGAPGFQVAFKYANSQLSLTFDSPPANHGVSMLEIQTVPTHHANWTSGFGNHSFARHPIIDRSATESPIQLVNPTPEPVHVDVSLRVGYPEDGICETLILSNVAYQDGPPINSPLTIPDSVTVDYARYADWTLPEPNAQAVVIATANADWESNDNLAWIEPAPVHDFPPKLRIGVYGEPREVDYHALARMIEVLRVIAPRLDARFAKTHDEVTLSVHFQTCQSWWYPYFGDCNPDGVNANYSIGDIEDGGRTDRRGFIWMQVVSDQRMAQEGWGPYNPQTLWHEVGHAVGLTHLMCTGSNVNVGYDDWGTEVGRRWSPSDLAAIAVHQDPRTVHGSSVHEAAEAVGIERNAAFSALLENPSSACENPDPRWAELWAQTSAH